MVARPFKAGTRIPAIDCVAERQLMRDRGQSTTKSFMRRSATPWMLVASFPGVKTPGYHRTSLREKRHLCFAAERQSMVARPFKAGTTIPTIDCVAERQLIRDRGQSSTKSFMHCYTALWILVACFRGTTPHPRDRGSGFVPVPVVQFDEPERRWIRHESPSRSSVAGSHSETSANP